MESSWTRDWTRVPCIDRWFPNYWIIRKSYSKVYNMYIYQSLASSNTTLIWVQCRNLTTVYLHFLFFFCAISVIHFLHMLDQRSPTLGPYWKLGHTAGEQWASKWSFHLPFPIACITTWTVPHLSHSHYHQAWIIYPCPLTLIGVKIVFTKPVPCAKKLGDCCVRPLAYYYFFLNGFLHVGFNSLSLHLFLWLNFYYKIIFSNICANKSKLLSLFLS